MIGAIIGDIAGSRFEFDNYREKDFEIFHKDSFFTDDTVMTVAVADAISMKSREFLPELVEGCMKIFGSKHACSYGGSFQAWLDGRIKGPYNSFGNGAAMRVSPCAYAAGSLEEAKELSRIVTEVTHNHPEGIIGAEAVTVAIYMALHGSRKDEIADSMWCYYDLGFTIDKIRPTYEFDETCQGTVPQAIKAFLEASDFEDAIRTAVSVGGDSDTLAAITGSIAEAYYGVPAWMQRSAWNYLTPDLKHVLRKFGERYEAYR